MSDDNFRTVVKVVELTTINRITFSPHIFDTDISEFELWEAYIENLTQNENCLACGNFIKRYGNKVVMNKIGMTLPLLWIDEKKDNELFNQLPEKYRKSIQNLYKLVNEAKITKAYIPETSIWGEKFDGLYNHLSTVIPLHAVKSGGENMTVEINNQLYPLILNILNEVDRKHLDILNEWITTNKLLYSDKYRSAMSFLLKLFMQEMKRKVEEREKEIDSLRGEIKALTRQQSVQRSGSHSHPAMKSTSRRESTGIDVLGGASPDSLRKELESKDSTIADMEFEISRLRGQLSSQTAGCEAHGDQIEALKASLVLAQGQLGSKEAELADLRKAMQRASEKSVLDGTRG